MSTVFAAAPVHVSDRSDAEAVKIAQATIEAMGGWEGWEQARYLRWDFFGGRHHWWDRYTGRVRIEAYGGEIKRLWLMNAGTGEGRYFEDGTEVRDPLQLDEALEKGRKIWINDSYWLVMPFKILDPGVTLRYLGEKSLPDKTVADVLELTFAEVGVTPDNKYELFVSRDSGLIEQWVFFETADAEASFSRPWLGWEKFGPILLSTGHGNDKDWAIDVPSEMSDAIFEDPSPVVDVKNGA